MKKVKGLILLILSIFLSSHAANTNYCSVPPFLSTSVSPNILLLIDKSGSMGWSAYNPRSDHTGWCNKNSGCGWTYIGDEEGYFIPDKVYEYEGSYPNGVWKETTNPENTCPFTWDAVYDGGSYKGACLNFLLMSRIDLLRWAITGGRPEGCNGFANRTCDPDLACSGDTCILETLYNDKVEVPKSRIKGVLQIFETVENRPRFGALFYSGSIYGDKVYIGDYPNGNNADPDYPYTYLKRAINYVDPGGSTGTAPAMWEAYDYFKQSNDHDYPNGFNIDPGTYKDPNYFCDANRQNCSPVPCARNFVILASDGQWNTGGYPANWTCTIETGFEDYSADPVVPAYKMHTEVLRNLSSISGNDYDISVNGIYALGLFLGGTGEQSLKNIAVYGSFDNSEYDWPNGTSGSYWNGGGNSQYPWSECDMDDCGNGRGSACTPLPPSSPDWDSDNDGNPDTFLSAKNAQEIKDSLVKFIKNILKRTSSGTTASILSQKRTQGAVVTQALFFPEKAYGDNNIIWTGNIYGYWFYVSKNIQNIREDSNTNLILDVTDEDDHVIEFDIDNNTGNTVVHRYKSNSDGTKGSELSNSPVQIEEISHLFRVGDLLRDVDGSSRNIYIEKDGSLVPFSSDNVIDNLLNLLTEDCLSSKNELISYIRGENDYSCRSRKTDDDKIWKLGDIIYSTPKVVDYRDYSVMFVGANDGMLHAFKVGKIRRDGLSIDQKAKLCKSLDDSNCPNYSSTDLKEIGKELWAFIPKNVLPYLKYLGDPDYCHMYFVDLSPYVIEEDTNKDGIIDKRVLIGGLRFGGATGCHKTSGGTEEWCSDDQIIPEYEECNPDDMSDCVGLSSYFALDITDPENPQFLWEFTDPYLGFSFSGPAYLKRGDNRYVMFVSGPTNYEGEVDGQDLNIFILGLDSNFKIINLLKIDGQGKDGFLEKSVLSDYNNAFGGRLFTEGIDANGDGKTDMVFFGVNQKTGNTWQGNVLGVKLTNDDDPTQWEIVQVFNSAIKPVTAKVEHMRCFNMNYIYFGTGRWFYKTDEMGQNSNDIEKLYGIRIDGCLQNNNCSLNYAHSSADNACQALQDGDLTTGWTIDQDLLPKGGGYFKERNITDPTPISSRNSNIIVFTTMQPSGDLCGYGGRTRLWALNCATGANINDTSCGGYVPKVPEGKLLLQLSLGNIEEQKLSEITEKHTDWFTGIPPESATPFASGSTPIGRIILWLEK